MGNNTRELLELINQQLKELVEIYSKGVNNATVSKNEFWIWYSLVIVNGEHSQQDICSAWSLSKQTVNTIITQMVQKKYVSLEVIPGTRNRKIIHLTEAGRKYGENIVMPIVNAEQKAFEKLSSKDRSAFMNILGKYMKILKEELDDTTNK